MDGTAFVTQCPIAPGNSFLYNFAVPNQAGTFWYHSHFHLQYCEGLRGPLIVYDPLDPYSNLYDVDIDIPERQYKTLLIALNDSGVPGTPGVGNADVNLNLVAQINQTTLLFEINGVAYKSLETLVLLQILGGAISPSQLLPQGSVYILPVNKTVEVSFPGALLAAAHPFHLHGHKFDVVRSAGMTGYNYVNPARRDTVSSGSPTDNVTIRFKTDNPGPWFLHW
ncbi:Cupredoxin [Pisolithus marmoratus]|nr:Cupredoxin [Pisolithus marmoratus]